MCLRIGWSPQSLRCFQLTSASSDCSLNSSDASRDLCDDDWIVVLPLDIDDF